MKHLGLLWIIGLALFSSSLFMVYAASESPEGDASIAAAFDTLASADRYDADQTTVNSMAARLNLAIALNEPKATGGPSETSIQESILLSEGVRTEAQALASEGVTRAILQAAGTAAAVAIASLATTTVTIRSYEWHTKREERKLLAMEIRRKGNEN